MTTHIRTRAVPGLIASGPARQVLYIDSDPFSAFVAKHLLESIGHKVTVFATHQEALDALSVRPDDWDIVVMDAGTPALHGLDAVKALHDRHPGLRYALISDDRLESAASAKLCTVHARPASVEEFGALVERVISHGLPPGPNRPLAASRSATGRRFIPSQSRTKSR
jgi:DNA-binding NtrC family response regulator